MPRARRQDYDGAWHHVMNRGARQHAIFTDDDDRRRFLVELHHASHRHGVETAAYCLMSNHFHLVLHTPAATLSRVMQMLSAQYTREHNSRHGIDGPIFRGRFKSVAIEETAQLIETTLYVHRNPVEAGLVERADAWAWSSAAAYVGAQSAPDWLNTALVLDVVGGPDPKSEYARLLAERTGKERCQIPGRSMPIDPR